MNSNNSNESYKQLPILLLIFAPVMLIIMYKISNKFCEHQYFTALDSFNIEIRELDYQGIFTFINREYVFAGLNNGHGSLPVELKDILIKDSEHREIKIVRSNDTTTINNYNYEGMISFMKQKCE